MEKTHGIWLGGSAGETVQCWGGTQFSKAKQLLTTVKLGMDYKQVINLKSMGLKHVLL